MHRGYIKLYRKIQDSFIFKDSQILHLWIHLLLEANHKDNEFIFNGKMQICKRGQIITGLNSLMLKTRINKSKLYRSLKLLENETLIETQKTNKFTLVTILKYEDYQSNETQSETPVKLKRNSSETPVKTNNNDKNVIMNKNDNNIYIIFQQCWNELMDTKILKMSSNRINKLENRIKNDPDFKTNFELCLSKIKGSDFLSGKGGGWRATFDWLIKNDDNYMKVLEDNYKNNNSVQKTFKQMDQENEIEIARKFIKGG